VAKVTSKLQVTIPKAIADAHGIEPGTELVFESADDVIRVVPKRRRRADRADNTRARLDGFDQGTRRQVERDRLLRATRPELFEGGDRGWRREELYQRGLPR
jgi:AbrB family looped-hinge helix DNA binding protein